MVCQTPNGEIVSFGWVQSVEQFNEMMRALYNEFGTTLAEDESHNGGIIGAKSRKA